MKILLINTVPTEKNGITNVMFNYLMGINTEGMQLDFLSINEPEQMYVTAVEKKRGKLYVLPRLNGTLAYWKGLRRLIKTNKYDAVHVHGNSHTLAIEMSAAWTAGCKVRIVHSHNTTCKYVKVHKLLTIPFNMLYTHGLACGEEAGKWMFGKKPFTVMNNGVDTKKYAFRPSVREEIRKQNNWDGCKVIGHVGSMIEAKNHKFILEVFKALYQRNHSVRLLLIGDGPLRPEVEAEVAYQGLKSAVTMTGNINNVDEYLNAMDLVLMPSLYEGLPLTLIEQQANGLKCVVADTITCEADKTKSLTFLSLSAPVSDWADTILDILKDEKGDRLNRSHSNIKKIADCGYSIQEEARKLNAYYLNAANRKKV